VSALVSLVMPVWRPRSDWLHEAVASALDERACEIELIVVDDGNDQPVTDVLAGVADPRLRVLRVEHAGPYAARNAALQIARGDYVRYVDADDVVQAGSTGKLLGLAEGTPGETMAYGATLMCDEELRPGRVVTADSEGHVAEECLLGGFEVFVVSILYPRAALVRAGPWEETAFTVSGDWDYVLRALEQAPVRRLDEVVSLYRRHPASVTKSARVAAGAQAGKLVLDRYFDRHPEQRGSPLERRAYSNLHIDRARAHAWARQPQLALRQLGMAARRDPFAASAALARFGGERLVDLTARAQRRARRAPSRPG
jgi:glycosyltransferase involved in cell wall biosynthesis